MPAGVTDLIAVQTPDVKPPVQRAASAAKPADDGNSFDKVLHRHREANQKKVSGKKADDKKAGDKPKTAKPADVKPNANKNPVDRASKDPAVADADAQENSDVEAKADTDAAAETVKTATKNPLEIKANSDDQDEQQGDVDDHSAVAKADPHAATDLPPAAGDHAADTADDVTKAAGPKADKHSSDDATKTTDAVAAAAAQTPVTPNQASAATVAAASTTAADPAVDAVATAAAKSGKPTPSTDAATKSAAPAAKKSATTDDTDSASDLVAEKSVTPEAKNFKTQAITDAGDDAKGDQPSADDTDAAAAAKPAAKTVDVAPAAADLAAAASVPAHDKTAAQPAVPVPVATTTPDRATAENNVARIVTSVRGSLGAAGGTMQIRLDPPTLGAVNVSVSFENGVMTASLTTENEQATRMLSHNLSALKTSLESAGVTVDKIQVKQAAPSEHSSSNQQQGSDPQSREQMSYNDSSRQEQQRREMMQRMWRRVSGNLDDLDLVA